MRINSKFEFFRYGINVRLATENDSEFLLSLRTDEKLSKYIHATSNDLELQKLWMRGYKEREILGIDYYFIYSYQGFDFGVNRIYDIEPEERGTGGSWICKRGIDAELSVSTLLIMRDIMFEILRLKYDCFDVRKGNKHVQKIHEMMGAKKVGETDLDFLYQLSKADYLNKRNDIINLLNIKV